MGPPLLITPNTEGKTDFLLLLILLYIFEQYLFKLTQIVSRDTNGKNILFEVVILIIKWFKLMLCLGQMNSVVPDHTSPKYKFICY